MQDVCLSFWRGDDIYLDMMLKVTGIYPTHPSDPTAYDTPMNMEFDQNIVRILLKSFQRALERRFC